jgi:hypothetical protein
VKIDVSDSSEFDRLLERLAKDIVEAAFRHLHADLSASTDEFSREFAQSPTFWDLTFQALAEAAGARLIRVYDTHKDALSLQSWLETIKDNLHLFGAGQGADSPDVIRRGATPPRPEQLNRDVDSVTSADLLVKKLIRRAAMSSLIPTRTTLSRGCAWSAST